MAKNLTEMCSSVLQKVELLGNSMGFISIGLSSEEIPKLGVEGERLGFS